MFQSGLGINNLPIENEIRVSDIIEADNINEYVRLYYSLKN